MASPPKPPNPGSNDKQGVASPGRGYVGPLRFEADVPLKDAPPRDRGRTFIEDDVVSVIARAAAENVPGVYSIGESSLRTSLPGMASRHHGVAAEVGMKEAAIDVEIVVEFGYPLRDVACQLREQIIEAVENMAARNVVEVNVFVVDIHVEKTQRRHRRELE